MPDLPITAALITRLSDNVENASLDVTVNGKDKIEALTARADLSADNLTEVVRAIRELEELIRGLTPNP